VVAAPQVVELLAAASQSQELAETVGEFFGDPAMARNVLATPDRTRNAIKLVAGAKTLEGVLAALSGAATT
jgi:hypothetical protein